MSSWNIIGFVSWKSEKEHSDVPKRELVEECYREEPERREFRVTVRRTDTNEPVDGVTVNLTMGAHAISEALSGSNGPGVVVFKQLDKGNYSFSAELPEGGKHPTYVEPPELSDVPFDQPGCHYIGLYLEIQPRLVLNEVSHHFAPSVESGDFDYSIQGLVNETVEIEINSDYYPNNPLYTRELTADEKADGENKKISWDGRVNGGGPLQNRYINPLYVPYKVKLKCNRVEDGETGEKEFFLLYHSIKMQDGTYTADDNEPDFNNELIKWVQYKLNKLGYFAGPVDNTDRAQFRRAIKRYTYAMPGRYGNDKTIDDFNNAKLQQQLTDGDGARQILENNRFPAAGEQAKACIDHDYFFEVYGNAARANDFLNPQGHTIQDNAVLDRFEYPLEVKVYLLSKNDNDGTGNGIDAPQAIGPVDIEWDVEDTPEDTNNLPAPGNPDIPSRTKNYVDAGLDATRGGPGDSNCNCPATNGNGQRPHLASNVQYFRIGNSLEPFTSQNVGGVVYCPVHADANANPNKIGRAGILFRGSYIAGDTYKIKAKISFTRHDAHNDRLIPSHTELADSTDKTLDDMLGATTGEIIIWRRQHISAVVNWPDPGRNIDLNGIAAMYAHAKCELDTAHESLNIGALFDTNNKRNAYLDMLENRCGWDRDSMEFNQEGLYPLPFREQGANESSADYKIYINGEVMGLGGIQYTFDNIAELVYKEVSMRRPAGTVVLRASLHAPVKIRRELCWILRKTGIQRLVNYLSPYYYRGDSQSAISAGMVKGVVLLHNEATAEDKDKYLFSHEMAHCRYLQHREVKEPGGGSKPEDHDTNDHNCIMSYAEFIPSRPNLHWSKNSPGEPRFCGKCVLKLRGWDVRDNALPAHS